MSNDQNSKIQKLRERAHQLKEKRPGYREILDFYVKVREAQLTSKASPRMDLTKPEKEQRSRPTEEGVSLIEEPCSKLQGIFDRKDFRSNFYMRSLTPQSRRGGTGKALAVSVQKEDFSVDIEASISLFHVLCRIAKTANPHMAEQVEKINRRLNDGKMDLKQLLARAGKEEARARVAAGRGIDIQVLSFLTRSSIRPSIETGRDNLRSKFDSEGWRKPHCPVCGSLPCLNILTAAEGKRYSLCSYCGYQWRIERVSCAVCGSEEQELLTYFSAEGEEACRIDLCDNCHHYIKTIDYRSLEASDPSLEDLATLHLDLVAVQKGYKRSVPSFWSA